MDVLTVSSKGQITIPQNARSEMKITMGDKLAYMVFGDTLIMKRVDMPSQKDFEKSLNEAQNWARKSGMTETDVSDAIKTVRAGKKS